VEAPDTAQPAPAKDPIADFLRTQEMNAHMNSIDVVETESEVSFYLEQAALTWSNGDYGIARKMLIEALKDPNEYPHRRRTMGALIDMTEIMAESDPEKLREAESLRMDYASEFDEAFPKKDTPIPDMSASVIKPDLSLEGDLDERIIPRVKEFQSISQTKHSLRIDFGHITSLDKTAATLLSKVFDAFRRSQKHTLAISGLNNLKAATLPAMRTPNPESISHWALLGIMLSLGGMKSEFERAANLFKKQFNQPMPTVYMAAPNITMEAQVVPLIQPTIWLSGDLGSEVAAEAAFTTPPGTAEVKIDCTKLTRLTFQSAAYIYARVEALRLKGRPVVAHNLRDPSLALLETIGLTAIATVVYA